MPTYRARISRIQTVEFEADNYLEALDFADLMAESDETVLDVFASS